LKEDITPSYFAAAYEDCHAMTWTDDDGREWQGIPLWLFVGRVDDDFKHNQNEIEAARTFADRIGVAKSDNMVEISLLEHCLRQDLNQRALRVMAVLKPLKVVITNYPEDKVEDLEAVNNPEDPDAGNRLLPFSRELYIERDDFREDAPRKYFRLAPGTEVRLKHAYYITCNEVSKDPITGEINTLFCFFERFSS